MTSPLWQSESNLGFPPGLCGFLAWRCLEAVLCVPAMYTRSPQLLLDHEPVGVHTQDGVEARPPPSGLRRGTPNSLMAVTGPSGVGGSCGVRVGWGGVLPGSPLGVANDPRLGLIEANLPTT